MGRIHGENTDLTGDTQILVPGDRQKYHCPWHEKILDVYYEFSTYIVVGSLRAPTNFIRSDVRRHMMNLEASRVVSIISHNNKEYDIIINTIRTVSTQILRSIIVTNKTTTVIHNSNPLCTQLPDSIVFEYIILVPMVTLLMGNNFQCFLLVCPLNYLTIYSLNLFWSVFLMAW